MIYWLKYETITGGSYMLHFSELFAFAEALNKAMENEFVSLGTITFWTEIK